MWALTCGFFILLTFFISCRLARPAPITGSIPAFYHFLCAYSTAVMICRIQMARERKTALVDTTLRSPKIPFTFIPNPDIGSGKIRTWQNLHIKESEGKGNGLFVDEGPAGLLIPFGGILISNEDRAKMLEKKVSIDQYSIDGTYKEQEGIFDAQSKKKLKRFYWPAAFANEPSKPPQQRFLRSSNDRAPPKLERYNSKFVLIDRFDPLYAEEMPTYPGCLPPCRYLWFLEMMIPVIPPGTSKRKSTNPNAVIGPVELFTHYGRSWRNCVRPYQALSTEVKDNWIKGLYNYDEIPLFLTLLRIRLSLFQGRCGDPNSE